MNEDVPVRLTPHQRKSTNPEWFHTWRAMPVCA
jgi:hypothetical protein